MDQEKTNTMEKKDIFQSFHSQFDPTIPPILQRTSCGIASLYMGLKYLGKDVGEYSTFLQKYIQHGSYNIPTYSMTMKIAGINTKVPISYFDNNQQAYEQAHIREVLAPFSNLNINDPITRDVNQNAEPKRAFTLEHGFDHRGIESFLKEDMGIENLSVELVESDTLPTSLAENSVILASVNQSRLGYPARLTTLKSALITTHIIPIVGIGELNDTNVALFEDSAFLDVQDGIQIRTIDSMNAALAGKYTIITENSEV